MPRRARVHLDDVPVHIVQRGHNRQPCFLVDDDYRAYLHWLGEALREADASLHAYALMTNHVHLLVTPRMATSIPRMIISLGRRYVQHINRTYHRTGTLWDSRYKSSLIQSESHLLTCQRYIEFNPVRAAMVADPALYRWTSLRAHAFGKTDPLLTAHSTYMAIGKTSRERQAAYRALFADTIPQSEIDAIRKALNHNHPLGTMAFKVQVERMTGIRCVPRPRGRPRAGGDSDALMQGQRRFDAVE